jgi:hypothetical protein
MKIQNFSAHHHITHICRFHNCNINQSTTMAPSLEQQNDATTAPLPPPPPPLPLLPLLPPALPLPNAKLKKNTQI